MTEEDFYVCTCGCMAISIMRYDFENDGKEISLVFWTPGRGRSRYSWGERLRDAWVILRRGFVVEEEIFLSRRDALRLLEKLGEWTKISPS